MNDYRIKSTGKGADFFGGCERCGEKIDLVYKQQYKLKSSVDWINCGYGHVRCLRNGEWSNAPVVGSNE